MPDMARVWSDCRMGALSHGDAFPLMQADACRRSDREAGHPTFSAACAPASVLPAVMCGTSLLFTLYHTVKFAGDLRRHLQVRQAAGLYGR